MDEIQLPDYLPSRYDNWLDLYLDVVRIFKEQGFEINDDTKVKLYELGDYEEQKEIMTQYGDRVVHFYQEFPLTLIKARAFDFIITKLPSQITMERLYYNIMTSPMRSVSVQEDHETLEKFRSICQWL